MNPVPLQIPGLESAEIALAKDQDEFVTLPALPIVTHEGFGLLTRWRPTEDERDQIAHGADVWLQTLTAGQPFQPVIIGTICPLDLPQEPS